MKILHIITRMDRGGSAVNTLFSAMEQQRAGHQVTLLYGLSLESEMSAQEQRKVDADVANFRKLGGQVMVLESLLRSLGRADIQAFREIRRIVKQGAFDIVHTHTSKTGALGRWAVASLPRQETRPKVVHTPHGHIFHGYFGRFKTQVFIAIERHLAAYTDALIALTRAERDDHLALGIGSPAQWRVIASGVDVNAIHQAVQAYHEKEKVWDAVSVGRLVSIKGMERLIAAWAKLCKHKPDARLVLVGDGEKRAELEAQAARLGIREQVYFAGWADPVPYLAQARCFALLSHNEGMGRAVVEAMAAGLGCVVSDVCGLKELVDEQVGMVVDADDAATVARAIELVGRQGWADAAWRRAEGYSLDSMIQALESLYQSLQHHGEHIHG